MKEWSVLVETVAEPSERQDDEHISNLLGELSDLLVDHGASVSGDGGGWSVRLSIDTDSSPHADLDAVYAGRQIVLEYAAKIELPAWPVVRLEAIEAAALELELARPTFPAVVGVAEVMDMLGVSRQRLHELRTAGRFPRPMVELAATPIWLRSGIEGFLERWDRRPGRPSRVQELLGENDDLSDELGSFGTGPFGDSDPTS